MEASVSEIHAHPLRPPGYAEPLFLGLAAKKEIAEHLRESSCWLGKASDVEKPVGQPCHVLRRLDGTAYVIRRRSSRRACRTGHAKRRVARVLERWREVGDWWEPGGGTDRLVFRLLLSGGAVVDVALERSGPRAGEWLWVGTLD